MTNYMTRTAQALALALAATAAGCGAPRATGEPVSIRTEQNKREPLEQVINGTVIDVSHEVIVDKAALFVSQGIKKQYLVIKTPEGLRHVTCYGYTPDYMNKDVTVRARLSGDRYVANSIEIR